MKGKKEKNPTDKKREKKKKHDRKKSNKFKVVLSKQQNRLDEGESESSSEKVPPSSG